MCRLDDDDFPTLVGPDGTYVGPRGLQTGLSAGLRTRTVVFIVWHQKPHVATINPN